MAAPADRVQNILNQLTNDEKLVAQKHIHKKMELSQQRNKVYRNLPEIMFLRL